MSHEDLVKEALRLQARYHAKDVQCNQLKKELKETREKSERERKELEEGRMTVAIIKEKERSLLELLRTEREERQNQEHIWLKLIEQKSEELKLNYAQKLISEKQYHDALKEIERLKSQIELLSENNKTVLDTMREQNELEINNKINEIKRMTINEKDNLKENYEEEIKILREKLENLEREREKDKAEKIKDIESIKNQNVLNEKEKIKQKLEEERKRYNDELEMVKRQQLQMELSLKDFETHKSERTIVELYLAHDKLKKEYAQLKLTYHKLEAENRRLTDQLSRVREDNRFENITEKFEALELDLSQEKNHNSDENSLCSPTASSLHSQTSSKTPPWRTNTNTNINNEGGTFRPRSKVILIRIVFHQRHHQVEDIIGRHL